MAIGSLSRAFENYARQDAEIRAANTQRAAEEAAALEAKRAELQAAGTPFFITDKFGDLSFGGWRQEWTVTRSSDKVKSNPYAFRFDSGGDQYVFIPEDVIQKGFVDADKTRQFYLTNALNKDTLKSLYEKGEAIDLSGGIPSNWEGQLTKYGYSTKGVLVPKSDFTELALNKTKSYEPKIISKDTGVGFITGLGQDKKGNLMYGGEKLGRSQYAYIDQEGRKAGYEKSKWGGFLGEMFYDIGKAIADSPFLPEVLGFATGNPYVYASTKGLAAGASGEDPLEAGLKIGATIGVTQALSGAGGQPTAQPSGVDYSLTAGGADVGGLGFKVPAGEVAGIQLAPDVVSEGLKLAAADLAPALGASVLPVNLGLGAQDYSLLGGTSPEQLATIGETGLLPGTAGEGLQLPQVPALPSMGGGQGLSVPVSGGTVTEAGFTPTGATPVLGDPNSFINDPNVLGQPVIQDISPGLSARDVFDALRGARSVYNALNPPASGQAVGGGLVDTGGFQPTGVQFPMPAPTQIARTPLPTLGPVISPYISQERLALLSQPYQTNLLGYQPNFSLLG